MLFTLKVNIKILLLAIVLSSLITVYTFLTLIPAYEKGDSNDIFLALLFRIPTKGFAWDYFYHMPVSEVLGLITFIFLIAIIMERIIAYLRFLERKENEEDNS